MLCSRLSARFRLSHISTMFSSPKFCRVNHISTSDEFCSAQDQENVLSLDTFALRQLASDITKYKLKKMKDTGNGENALFTVSVEGNIGAGKSTLLSYFGENEECEVVPEPLEKWCNMGGKNLLELLYSDPKRWSFAFNQYAMLTRLQMHQSDSGKHVKLLERSLPSTRYVFIENSYICGDLTTLEYTVLDQWFKYFVKATNETKVDLYVYLRAEPEKCYARIKARARAEEEVIPYEFISSLHRIYEDWLVDHKFGHPGAPVLVLDANLDKDNMVKTYQRYKSDILAQSHRPRRVFADLNQ